MEGTVALINSGTQDGGRQGCNDVSRGARGGEIKAQRGKCKGLLQSSDQVEFFQLH